MRVAVNRLIAQFDEMPLFLRFLVAVGLAIPLIVIVTVIDQGVTFNTIGMAVVCSPAFAGAYLIIKKIKYSRKLYFTGFLLATLSPYLVLVLNEQYPTYIELLFDMSLIVIIGSYLFMNGAVSNYFMSK